MIGNNGLVEKACKATRELLGEGKKVYDSMKGALNQYGEELIGRFVQGMFSNTRSQPCALVENPNDMLREYHVSGPICAEPINVHATSVNPAVMGDGQVTLDLLRLISERKQYKN